MKQVSVNDVLNDLRTTKKQINKEIIIGSIIFVTLICIILRVIL